MNQIHKYPRTHHLQGSRLQPGDEDLSSLPFSELAGRNLVVEEKVDGANAAVSFSPDGELRLQSRGHYLVGGGREKHFRLFKTWAATHRTGLHAALGSRYVMYGEWLYAKHTIFYDALPHYFLEFDVLDTREGVFLDTPRRRSLLRRTAVASVPVLHRGALTDPASMTDWIGPSAFSRPGHLERLERSVEQLGLRPAITLGETDPSRDMEGLYVKVEEGGVVQARYKYVRASFLTVVQQSESHWLSRPVVPNQLAPGVDLFQLSESEGGSW